MKKALLGLAAVGLMGASAFAGTVDFVFVVDESGSMAGEQAWLATMITSLDAKILGTGNTARYGLVGFGSATVAGHKHLVGGGDFGTAAQFATATGGLVVDGGTEDGWEGINFALNNYAFGAGNAVNIVLVTDEDRDNTGAPTLAALKANLDAKHAMLNAIVEYQLRIDGVNKLGVKLDGSTYTGYTPGAGGTYTSGTGAYTSLDYDGDAPTAQSDYVDLAWYTGGVAWDLTFLRNGGNNANSFTNAFVDIKVQEVITQLAPLPPAVWGGLSILGALGFFRSRRRKQLELS